MTAKKQIKMHKKKITQIIRINELIFQIISKKSLQK